LTLNPGELLVLYSDGVIESPSLDGDDFGIDGILRSLPMSSCARTVASAIAEAATSHAAGRAQYDDLSVMVIAA
jgi:serine phosphatase RsbU (regulator of sigma subunit)